MRLTRTALPLSGHIFILFVFLFLVYYDAYLGRNSIHFKNIPKNILKIVTKIITKNLSKSYNKKIQKSVVDTYLLFKLYFRDDFWDNFHDIFKCIELHPWLPPPDWAASVVPTLLRVPPTTEARLWSTLTDLAGVGASYEDLDVCN